MNKSFKNILTPQLGQVIPEDQIFEEEKVEDQYGQEIDPNKCI